MHRRFCAGQRVGFTLIELLVVIVILAILVGLLLPVISGARNRALESAQVTEFGLLQIAISQTEAEPPPSRLLLIESGDYSDANVPVELRPVRDETLRYFRGRWPKLAVSTSGPTAVINEGNSLWHDFDGNGSPSPGMVLLDGFESYVFALGGVPQKIEGSEIAMTGWSRNPQWPFAPNFRPHSVSHQLADSERIPPRFPFAPSRLIDRNDNWMPEYLDYLGQMPIAYFRGYSQGYNLSDCDLDGEAIGVFWDRGVKIESPGPNPYCSGSVAPDGNRPIQWHAPNQYQFLAAGSDGVFGPGGRFVETTDGDRLPVERPPGREAERDNLTSFAKTALR